MALIDKLENIQSQTEALLDYANGVTGGADERLGDAVKTLAEGFGGGGAELLAETVLHAETTSGTAEEVARLPFPGDHTLILVLVSKISSGGGVNQFAGAFYVARRISLASGTVFTALAGTSIRTASSGYTTGAAATGVYPSSINNGVCVIQKKYTSYSGAVDGDFSIKVFGLHI